MSQEDLSRRYKVSLLHAALVVEPSGTVLDAALRLGAIGHVRRDLGPLGALAGHHAADQRGQGSQVPGHSPGRLSWVPLCQGIPYGTILAAVVTHRRLLAMCVSQHRGYDGSTSYSPFAVQKVQKLN